MTTRQLREVAKERIESLPPDQLKVADEFLRYLEERASQEATEELLRIPGLLDDVKQAERDAAQAKGVNWREVRQDV